MNQPPKVAKWLLRHFGCSPNNPAIVGDLDERLGEGRSRGWYWHEVLIAIMAGIFEQVRTYKLRALRSLIFGWVLLNLFGWLRVFLLIPLWPHLSYGLNVGGNRWIELQSILLPILVSSELAWPACVGWLLARTNRPNGKAMVLLLILCVIPARVLILLIRVPSIPSPRNLLLMFFYNMLLLSVSLLFGGGFFRRAGGTDSEVFRPRSM